MTEVLTYLSYNAVYAFTGLFAISFMLMLVGVLNNVAGENTSLKWWGLTAFLLVFIVFYRVVNRSDNLLPLADVFKGTAVFLLMGAAYSFVEFWAELKRSQRKFRIFWESILDKPVVKSFAFLTQGVSKPLLESEEDVRHMTVREALIYLEHGPIIPCDVEETLVQISLIKDWDIYQDNNGKNSPHYKGLLSLEYELNYVKRNATSNLPFDPNTVWSANFITPIYRELNRIFSEAKRSIRTQFIEYSVSEDATEILRNCMPAPESSLYPIAVINPHRLKECVPAWIIFWPFYALNSLLGHFLLLVGQDISVFLIKISTKYLRDSFLKIAKESLGK